MRGEPDITLGLGIAKDRVEIPMRERSPMTKGCIAN
jgi:hypothetical protein